jgi:hypothetical protein
MATELRDVPEDQVAAQVAQAIQAGVTSVECWKQADGRWTIRVS